MGRVDGNSVGETSFSAEDDDAIAQWVANHPKMRPQQKALWNAAARSGVTRHSSSAMQQRWLQIVGNKSDKPAGVRNSVASGPRPRAKASLGDVEVLASAPPNKLQVQRKPASASKADAFPVGESSSARAARSGNGATTDFDGVGDERRQNAITVEIDDTADASSSAPSRGTVARKPAAGRNLEVTRTETCSGANKARSSNAAAEVYGDVRREQGSLASTVDTDDGADASSSAPSRAAVARKPAGARNLEVSRTEACRAANKARPSNAVTECNGDVRRQEVNLASTAEADETENGATVRIQPEERFPFAPSGRAQMNPFTARARESNIGRLGAEQSERIPASAQLRLSQMVAIASRDGSSLLVLPHKCEDSRRVPVLSSMRLEAAGGAAEPSVIRSPGLVISGEGTKVVLKDLIFEASLDRGNILEIRDGAQCEIIDCQLRRGGVALTKSGSVRVIRSTVTAAPGAGFEASGFQDLMLQGCRVTRCVNDGIRLCNGVTVQMEDCTLSHNGQNGMLVDGTASGWRVARCTFASNGQFGIWADAGAFLNWGPNSLIGNKLGEKSGRGDVQGWVPGACFKPGDGCVVWNEDRKSWLSGQVITISRQSATVLAKMPKKRKAPQKAKESAAGVRVVDDFVLKNVIVQPRALQQPISGSRSTPSWSLAKPTNMGYEHFLYEGGSGFDAWGKLPAEVRADYEARAKKARAKQTRTEKLAETMDNSKKRKFARALSGGLFGSFGKKKPKR